MDVKQAVTVATRYFHELFPSYTENLELEEVEFLPGDGSWLVTLGYDKPAPSRPLLALVQPAERHYKVVHVDASGEPLSIRMRQAS
jgi:hypothetical protein